MSFNLNVGYRFKREPVGVDRSIILAVGLPMHGVQRRDTDDYPHLKRRLFDPQLYLAGLDARTTPDVAKHCAVLASYPWFDIDGLDDYDSAQHSQRDWKKQAISEVPIRWSGTAPTSETAIDRATREAVKFQVDLGCEAIILPSPLTRDPASDYSLETQWLEYGLRHAVTYGNDLPVYATVALQDLCLLYAQPLNNELIDVIADVTTSRGIDGIYLVIEQGSEPEDTRQCGNSRVLQSVLHITHIYSHLAQKKVIVNFMGAFGLACVAAGADAWATGWYKSLYRLKLADKYGGGRSFPMYWSDGLAADIHLRRDFDLLVKGGMLPTIATQTSASRGLLTAASRGKPVASVADWKWRMSNITSAQEHFLLAMAAFDHRLRTLPPKTRMDEVQKWLADASSAASAAINVLGNQLDSKLSHVEAWASAFSAYRADHNV